MAVPPEWTAAAEKNVAAAGPVPAAVSRAIMARAQEFARRQTTLRKTA